MATGIYATQNVESPPSNLTLDQLKQDLYQNLRYRLGDQIVDLELDDEHFQSAYTYAIRIFRQRSQNATQETYTLMTLQKDVDVYTLPSEFINVRNVYRRTIGLETGPGSTAFDPFSSAILNTYLLNYNFAGGLTTYHLYASYTELAARMFGGYVIYTFNPVTKILRIVRDPKATGERILIHADMQRPEIELLQDPYTGVWIGDWILSVLKGIIGEAREKFGSVPGPQGTGQLNGQAMKAESKEMQKDLLEDLKRYVDGSQPITFCIG